MEEKLRVPPVTVMGMGGHEADEPERALSSWPTPETIDRNNPPGRRPRDIFISPPKSSSCHCVHRQVCNSTLPVPDRKKKLHHNSQSAKCDHSTTNRNLIFKANHTKSTRLLIKLSILFLAATLTSSPITAFNLDNRTALIHHGPAGTYFGFDVALHRDRTNNWLLVGAPRAQTNQPGVERGGAVYRCSAEAMDACQQVPFDQTGHSMTRIGGRPEQADSKSNQWMGAVVRSSGSNVAGGTESGFIVACAPRYVYFSTNFRRREPVGTCWVSRGSFTGFLEYSPCRTTSWGYHRQGSCQAGFAASISKNGRIMYVGAPGSWYWQGQVFSIDLNLPLNQSMHSTSEAPEYDDDSFLGYSSTVGHFGGSTSWIGTGSSTARAAADEDVAVGMPRGQNLTGKVVVYDSRMRNLFNITGDQMGAYFGYALATGDLNGDHLDDLIIGAPLYSDPSASKRGAYERGRVYVAYQINRDLERARSGQYFEIRTILDGPDESRARFGFSLSVVGDLNKDSYDDLAVGAPYGGPNNRGVVFIYMGAPRGDQVTLSQTIYAEDFGDGALKTFGFSLSGGLDIDGNLYPDLLVGAYDSDRVIQLRSRPVVNMSASLNVDPELVHLDRKQCILRDREQTRVACISVTVCFQYTGMGLDSKLDLYYDIKLDSAARRSPRLFFLDREQESEHRFTVNLIRETQYCNTQRIYLVNNVRDKLTPLKVELEYGLLDLLPDSPVLKPILNKSSPNRIMKQINIQKNCGTDNICKPDLRLKVGTNMSEYLIGSSQRIDLNVAIHNAGEDAFESVLNLFMPMDVNFVKIVKQKGDLVTCTGAEPDRTGTNVLSCDIGNPLKGNHSVEFDVLVEPTRFPSGAAAPDYTFVAQVNSSNAEAESLQIDNQVEEGIPVRVEVNLTTSGLASLDSVLLNVSETIPDSPDTDEEIGPEIIHTYHVINRGPSAIRSARAVILWPTKNLQDKYLLYLMDQPQVKAVRAQASCRPLYSYEVNPYRVRVSKSPTTQNHNHHYTTSSTPTTSQTQHHSHNTQYPSTYPYSTYHSSSISSSRSSSNPSSSVSIVTPHSSHSYSRASVIGTTNMVGLLTPPYDLPFPTSDVSVLPVMSGVSVQSPPTSTTTARPRRFRPESRRRQIQSSSASPQPKQSTKRTNQNQNPSNMVYSTQPGMIGPRLRPTTAHSYPPTDYTWTVSRDYASDNDSLLELVSREKRHYRGVSTTPAPASGETSLESLLSCGRSQCTKIECEITDLERDSSVTFTVRSRLWRDTVRETMLEEVYISSKLVTIVTRLPYDVNPAYIGPQTASVFTRVHVTGMERAGMIPLWIIILAVVGGLLALSLLALLLYKLGFFKRTKVPHDEFERQPLRAARK